MFKILTSPNVPHNFLPLPLEPMKQKLDVNNLCTQENNLPEIKSLVFQFPTLPKPTFEDNGCIIVEKIIPNCDIKFKAYDPFKKKPKNTTFKSKLLFISKT